MSSNGKNEMSFLKELVNDITNGEFKKMHNIVPFIIALVSPTIPVLFLFKSDYVKENDIFKMLLICISINIVFSYTVYIFISGFNTLKKLVRKKKSYILLLKIKKLRKNYKEINKHKEKLIWRRRRNFLKRIQLVKKRNKLEAKLLEKDDSYFSANFINMVMGLAVVCIKVWALYFPRENEVRDVILTVGIVYVTIMSSFFIIGIYLIYLWIKELCIKRLFNRVIRFRLIIGTVNYVLIGGTSLVKKLKIGILGIAACILNILIIVIIPISLNFKIKNTAISYDSWLQFYGSIGGALLGGSVTVGGLYFTLRQNSKDLETQRNIDSNARIEDKERFEKEYRIKIINDKLNIYKELYLVLKKMNLELFKIVENFKNDTYKLASNKIHEDILDYRDMNSQYIFLSSLIDEEQIINKNKDIQNICNELINIEIEIDDIRKKGYIDSGKRFDDIKKKLEEFCRDLNKHGEELIEASISINKQKQLD